VPAERHTHYDAEGNETGYTVVERESRFSDADRAEFLALSFYERDLCGDCGTSISLGEQDVDVRPGTRHCTACAAIAGMSRILAVQDEAASERLQDAPPQEPRPGDGRHLTLEIAASREKP